MYGLVFAFTLCVLVRACGELIVECLYINSYLICVRLCVWVCLCFCVCIRSCVCSLTFCLCYYTFAVPLLGFVNRSLMAAYAYEVRTALVVMCEARGHISITPGMSLTHAYMSQC